MLQPCKCSLVFSSSKLSLWGPGDDPSGVQEIKTKATVTDVGWTRNNNVVVFCSDDGTVTLNVSGKGNLAGPFTMEEPPRPFNAVSISPSSRYLAAGGSSARLFIYKLRKRAVRTSLLIEGEAITALDWMQDSKQLAVGTSTGDILVYLVKPKPLTLLCRAKTGDLPVTKLRFLQPSATVVNRMGRLAYCTGGGSVGVFDVRSKMFLRRFEQVHNGPATGVAFDGTEGNTIVSCGLDGIITFHDLIRSGVVKWNVSDPLCSLDVSVDRHVAAGSMNGDVHIWSLGQGTIPRIPPTPMDISVSSGKEKVRALRWSGVISKAQQLQLQQKQQPQLQPQRQQLPRPSSAAPNRMTRQSLLPSSRQTSFDTGSEREQEDKKPLRSLVLQLKAPVHGQQEKQSVQKGITAGDEVKVERQKEVIEPKNNISEVEKNIAGNIVQHIQESLDKDVSISIKSPEEGTKGEIPIAAATTTTERLSPPQRNVQTPSTSPLPSQKLQEQKQFTPPSVRAAERTNQRGTEEEKGRTQELNKVTPASPIDANISYSLQQQQQHKSLSSASPSTFTSNNMQGYTGDIMDNPIMLSLRALHSEVVRQGYEITSQFTSCCEKLEKRIERLEDAVQTLLLEIPPAYSPEGW